VEDATQLRLVEHQGLICRVVKLGGPYECPHVTTKLSNCWDYSTEVNILLEIHYFSMIHMISSISSNSQRYYLNNIVYSIMCVCVCLCLSDWLCNPSVGCWGFFVRGRLPECEANHLTSSVTQNKNIFIFIFPFPCFFKV
jgi:hypothetical protein